MSCVSFSTVIIEGCSCKSEKSWGLRFVVFLEAEEVGCETFAHCKKSFFLVNLKVRVICFLLLLSFHFIYLLFLDFICLYSRNIYIYLFIFFYDLFSNWL